MSFTADKQTLDDLSLLGKYKPDSIYSLFNRVHTAGGEKLLEALFQHPLTDADEINRRSELFRYFQQKKLAFPLVGESLNVMENYLGAGGGENFLMAMAGTARRKLLDSIVRDEAYVRIKTGLLTTIGTLRTFFDFMNRLEREDGLDGPFGEQLRSVKKIFQNRRLEGLRTAWERGDWEAKELSWLKVARYDHLLRRLLQMEMATLTGIIYQLDVYMAVGYVAAVKGFTYAHALPAASNTIRATGLRHPRLERAVGNPLSLHQDKNMLFLTGANMAGKSTLMKAFGISVYLAHMGFPLAAEEMTFSVKDGIYSSINVPDNLSLGHSHFYAEVLRVKKVALEVSLSKDLVVIFDELFKGTNVKDAYDATLAVTEALSEYRNCCFIISTHIIEVGETLRERHANIQFARLPTIMEGMTPRYLYKLEEGITADRHGMMIIENEGILGILSGHLFT
ncbi:MAG TPA: hypothetical protein VL832_17405 [Puia sp.]|nr:hypothetical protein [Puia sp.]